MTQEETTVATAVALRSTEKAIDFFSEVIGEPVKDLVGLMGADWLKVQRERNLINLREKSDRLLRDRKIENPEPVSLSVAIPLLAGAADESRDELAKIWAALLAAARDPKQSNNVGRMFIDIVKKMEPNDVRVLLYVQSHGPGHESDTVLPTRMSNEFNWNITTVFVSLFNLTTIGLVRSSRNEDPAISINWPLLTPIGKELLRLIN